jgi:hypothetical protein
MKAIKPKFNKSVLVNISKRALKPNLNNLFRYLVLLLVGLSIAGYFQLQAVKSRFAGNENWIRSSTDDLRTAVNDVRLSTANYEYSNGYESPVEYTIVSTTTERISMQDESENYGHGEDLKYSKQDVLVVVVRAKNTSNTVQSLTASYPGPVAGLTAQGELLNDNTSSVKPDEIKGTRVSELAPGGVTEYHLYFKKDTKLTSLFLRPTNQTIKL